MKALQLIVVLLYLSFTAQAQLCETANCNNLKDYCNAQITKAYIQEYLAKKSKPDSINYEKIRGQAFSEISIRNHPDYETLSAALSTDFKKTKERLTDKINAVAITVDDSSAEHSGELFIAAIDTTIPNEIKSQLKGYTELKSALQTELTEYFKRALRANEQAEVTVEKPVVTTPQRSDEVDISIDRTTSRWLSFKGFNLWIAMLLLLNALLFGFIFNVSRRKRRKSQERHHDSNEGNHINIQQFNLEFMTLRSDFSANKKELDNLKQKVNELTSRLEQQPTTERPRVDERENTPPNGIDRNTMFYMAFPIGNYFSNKGRSDSKPDTFYTFQLSAENRNEASFHIHAGEAMVKEYLTMAEECIKPACQEQNMASPSVKRIITERPGTALLEDDKWMIKTKAIIRYE